LCAKSESRYPRIARCFYRAARRSSASVRRYCLVARSRGWALLSAVEEAVDHHRELEL
jgi:hypothetical protein